jgi:hypothetical protein
VCPHFFVPLRKPGSEHLQPEPSRHQAILQRIRKVLRRQLLITQLRDGTFSRTGNMAESCRAGDLIQLVRRSECAPAFKVGVPHNKTSLVAKNGALLQVSRYASVQRRYRFRCLFVNEIWATLAYFHCWFQEDTHCHRGLCCWDFSGTCTGASGVGAAETC